MSTVLSSIDSSLGIEEVMMEVSALSADDNIVLDVDVNSTDVRETTMLDIDSFAFKRTVSAMRSIRSAIMMNAPRCSCTSNMSNENATKYVTSTYMFVVAREHALNYAQEILGRDYAQNRVRGGMDRFLDRRVLRDRRLTGQINQTRYERSRSFAGNLRI
jgi:hypothetical protein